MTEFQNPVVGGVQLVRSAIQSPNYQSGLLGWTINKDGSAEYNDLTTRGTAQGASAAYNTITANDSLIYKGTELQTLLDALPKGIIASGSYQGALNLSTGENSFAYFTFTAQPNRMYVVEGAPLEMDVSTVGRSVGYRMRYTTDGTTPTLSSPVLPAPGNVAYGKPSWSGDVIPRGWYVNTTQNPQIINILITIVVGESDVTSTAAIWAGDGWAFWADDKGSISTAGYVNNALTVAVNPPPPPQSHNFQIQSYATASYQGSGHQSAGGGTDLGSYMYFGEDPGYAPNGNWRSYCWFDTATVLGAQNYASLTAFGCYFYTGWWYEDAGGTLFIGLVTYDASGGVPTTEPAGSTYQLTSQNFTQRGQGLWINLLGVPALVNALKAGTLRGLCLGPGPTTSYAYYGNAQGQDDVNSRPQLAATYTK